MEASKRPSSCISKWQYSSTKSKIVSNFNPDCQVVQKLTLKGKFVITLNQKKSTPGKCISVKIYSGTEVDPSKYILHTNTVNVFGSNCKFILSNFKFFL